MKKIYFSFSLALLVLVSVQTEKAMEKESLADLNTTYDPELDNPFSWKYRYAPPPPLLTPPTQTEINPTSKQELIVSTKKLDFIDCNPETPSNPLKRKFLAEPGKNDFSLQMFQKIEGPFTKTRKIQQNSIFIMPQPLQPVAQLQSNTPAPKPLPSPFKSLIPTLFSAIEKNDIAKLKTILENKPTSFVKKILEAKESSDARFYPAYTPLHYASVYDRCAIVKFLIQYGAPINDRTEKKQTPLYLACRGNYFETALLLINNGANVNAKSSNGLAPIHWAVENINLKLLESLIQKNAKIDEPTITDETPLLLAAQNSNCSKTKTKELTGIIQLLVDRGANIYKTKKDIQNTALHFLAAQKENIKAIELLAKKRTLNNLKNNEGNTPLHLACMHEKELSKRMNDVIASSKDRTQIVQLLINNGAFIDLQNLTGFTPFQIAIRFNDEATALALLKNGAIIEFTRKGNARKPYVRNLPKVLSAFFKEYLKKNFESVIYCLENSRDWLIQDNELFYTYDVKNKELSTQNVTQMSIEQSLVRKLIFCLFFKPMEIHRIKIDNTQAIKDLKNKLTLTAKEYELYMTLFNNNPKDSRIRALLGYMEISKSMNWFLNRLRSEALSTTPCNASKKVGLIKHDIRIKFTITHGY